MFPHSSFHRWTYKESKRLVEGLDWNSPTDDRSLTFILTQFWSICEELRRLARLSRMMTWAHGGGIGRRVSGWTVIETNRDHEHWHSLLLTTEIMSCFWAQRTSCNWPKYFETSLWRKNHNLDFLLKIFFLYLYITFNVKTYAVDLYKTFSICYGNVTRLLQPHKNPSFKVNGNLKIYIIMLLNLN